MINFFIRWFYSTNYKDIGILYIFNGAVADFFFNNNILYYYINILFNFFNFFFNLFFFYKNIKNNYLIIYIQIIILEIIYYFNSNIVLWGRIKFSDIFKNKNINIKRHYSSKLKYSKKVDDYEIDIKKICINQKELKDILKQFEKIMRHSIIINKLSKEGEYVNMEFVNITTKSNDIKNYVLDDKGKNKEIKGKIIKIDDNSYMGFRGIVNKVYKLQHKIEESEKMKDILKEHVDEYSSNEEIVNKVVDIINNNKDEIEILNLNKLKLEGKYKGEFIKNESYKDFIDNNKFID